LNHLRVGIRMLACRRPRPRNPRAVLHAKAVCSSRRPYSSPHPASLRSGMSIDVSQSVTIGRPAAELYERWRDLPRLPELMQHLESVTVLDERRSHWVAKGPADTKVEWEATIVEDVPGEVISWRSVEGSEIPNEGRVEFNRAPAD